MNKALSLSIGDHNHKSKSISVRRFRQNKIEILNLALRFSVNQLNLVVLTIINKDQILLFDREE